MPNRELTVQTCCGGALAEQFDQAVDVIMDDLAKRPHVGDKRVITLKIEFTPKTMGQFEMVCSGNPTIPRSAVAGMGYYDPIKERPMAMLPFEEPELDLQKETELKQAKERTGKETAK